MPQTVLANGDADFAIAWVPKALASREAGANIIDIAQVFQRSGTLQVQLQGQEHHRRQPTSTARRSATGASATSSRSSPRMTKAGLDPATDVDARRSSSSTWSACSTGDIDAAEAMTYNEYAQVLEAENPDTGELYTPDDFNVIYYEDEGVGMLQDAIWADGSSLVATRPTRTRRSKFVAASLQGWAYCRDNAEECADIVVADGLEARRQPPAVADERDQQAHLAGRRAASASSTRPRGTAPSQIAQKTKNLEGTTVLTKAPDAEAYTNDIVTARSHAARDARCRHQRHRLRARSTSP